MSLFWLGTRQLLCKKKPEPEPKQNQQKPPNKKKSNNKTQMLGEVCLKGE